MDTIQKLDLLAEYQAQLDLLELQKQELIDRVLTPEIKAQLEEIETEFAGKADAVSLKIAELQEQIRREVVSIGATVKAAHYQAVYTNGRVSWDSKALDGYATAHPEVARFRKLGAPSVSLRKI
jgi:hypothetical protein